MVCRRDRAYLGAVFFPVSKALAWVADPAYWAALLLVAAVVVARWRLGLASGLVALAVVVLAGLSSPVVAGALQRRVEASAPSTFRPGHRYDAAVVLGGSDARIEGGAEVVLGGNGEHLFYTGEIGPEASERLVRELTALGIPREDVVVGPRARNTYENAVEASEAMARRGWRSIVVVTSAVHAPRALACFHRLGLEPDVLPVDYSTPPRGRRGWLPSQAGLDQSRAVLHEVIGRVVYEVVGYAS